jgi:hypothetical protein
MNVELVKEIQEAVGVTSDGIIGNVTLNAIADKLGIPPKAVKVEPTTDNKGKSLIKIAESQLGIFETSKNHGEGIAKYWTATTYPDGYDNREPYCAAAVCWMVREAGKFTDATRPKTASAYGFESWAEKNGLKLSKHPSSVKAGQIVIFSFSHIGICVKETDFRGNFETIEANTSQQGVTGSQRDGGGVWRRSRNLSLVRSTVTI